MTPEQEEIARLKCVLLEIRDVASGQRQVSHDDTEALNWIESYVTSSLRLSPDLPPVKEATIARESL